MHLDITESVQPQFLVTGKESQNTLICLWVILKGSLEGTEKERYKIFLKTSFSEETQQT